MDQQCYPLLRGEVIRVTRLDGCGRVVDTACSTVTTDGFIEIGLTARITEGETVEVRKANGKTCISDTAPSTWDGWDMSITFCNVDPLLFTMMTGQHVVYDASGVPIGFSLRDNVDLKGQGVAIELWSNVAGAGASCDDPNAEGAWGYSIFPFVQGGVLGDRTISNAEVTFTIQNMQTKPGSSWGVGTNNVMLDGGGSPTTLLEPIDSHEHERLFLTGVAPPTPGCSCAAEGTAATGADEGAPGTWTPADTYAPFSFDDLTTTDPTASPATAWGTGSYVVLGDGTTAYWDGSAWVEGEAP
jgi:hypothetical protein